MRKGVSGQVQRRVWRVVRHPYNNCSAVSHIRQAESGAASVGSTGDLHGRIGPGGPAGRCAPGETRMHPCCGNDTGLGSTGQEGGSEGACPREE